MSVEKIPFLSKVKCNCFLKKYKEKGGYSRDPDRYLSGWRKPKFSKPEPFKGYFLGYRTVWEGFRERDFYNGGNVFIGVNKKKVALVVFKSNVNPVYVDLDDMEVVK